MNAASPGRRRRRSWPHRLLIAIGLCLSTALLLGAAGLYYAKSRLDDIQTVALGGVLTPRGLEGAGLGPTTIENYLLVGSDSREGEDPSSPDYGGIGSADQVGGERSDTIMVLRFDPATNSASLLSLPRDLFVPIAGKGRKDRINSAFSDGPDVLVRTVQESLGIPIHHYVQVDFQGFKRIVDAVGGVGLWFDHPARDKHTGLAVDQTGCVQLSGVEALQFARSRYYEEFRDGKWRSDPTSDLGRIQRQQHFLRAALEKALSRALTSPIVATKLVGAAVDNLKIDDNLDIWGLANRIRTMGAGNLQTYTLPANGKMVGGAAVLLLDKEAAAPILAYFKGAPTVAAAASTSAAPAAAKSAAPAGGKASTTAADTTVAAAPDAPPPPPSTVAAEGVDVGAQECT